VIKLRGTAGIAAGVLIILAGLGMPAAATTTQAAAAASAQALGTDISDFTTVTSWPDVAADGPASFVGVETEQGTDTGGSTTNKNYASEVAGATSAGMFVMPYIFADPGKVPTGSSQFSIGWNVISTAPYAKGGQMLPVALDMEWDTINFPNQECYGLSQSATVKWIQQFVTAAEQQTGLEPVIYTSQQWWKDCTGATSAFAADPLWVANYDVPAPALPGGWVAYTFWQSSDTATINGISGGAHADLDQLQSIPATLTAAAGGHGSQQAETLNGMAGQPVTYTATGLGTGMSLSSSGVFSWTASTPVGSYPVTVTPSTTASTPVVPASVSFRLHVHAPITVAGSSHTTTAGTPVSFQVTSSGQDQAAGFKPTFTATGLPAGLTMNSAGLVTGWPYVPGSYTVKVTASDALGGSGTVSVPWKISASGDSGTTGTIKQVGGSAKCLNDPGGSTANGAKPNMWTCDGKTYQSWTVVQDGTIRTAGKCLQMAGNGSAANTTLELETCNSGNAEQQWQAGSYGELINPASGKCVYIGTGTAANGYLPVAHSCANDARHHFLRPAAPVVSGQPGKCLAVSGNVAEIVTCASTASQHWVAESAGTFKAYGKCLAETGTAAGAKASIAGCAATPPTWEKWTVVAAGRIAVELKNVDSGHCVTIPPGATASGTGLLMEPCANNPAGTWRVG
jgi:GH25 family lysozyme M1 (1,4-beta-N-acetylmuramidase)